VTTNLDDRKRVIAAVAILAETFNRTMSDGAMEGYFLVLKELSEAELGHAVKRALGESKFMPTPAELLAFCGRGGTVALEDATAEAWEAVRTAMVRHGYTHSVDFGPLVNAVVRNIGGWLELNDKTIDELVWVRKDFERLYEAFAAKPADGLNGDALRGAFGGVPVRIPIGGKKPLPALTDGARNAVSGVVRDIAKAMEKREP
jgi:hypothetical protein